MKACDDLREIVERIEDLQKQRKKLDADIKDVLCYAKGCGYNIKVIRAVLRKRQAKAKGENEQKFLLNEEKLLQKMNADERAEYEFFFKLYCNAINI